MTGTTLSRLALFAITHLPSPTTLTCDGCGADIAYTGNSIDYRLALEVQRMPSRGGFVTDMMIYPPLGHDCYFCGLRCLDHWTDRRRLRDKIVSDWWQAWRAQNGTATGGGFTSYPSVPDDERAAAHKAAERAALKAFPMKNAPTPAEPEA